MWWVKNKPHVLHLTKTCIKPIYVIKKACIGCLYWKCSSTEMESSPTLLRLQICPYRNTTTDERMFNPLLILAGRVRGLLAADRNEQSSSSSSSGETKHINIIYPPTPTPSSQGCSVRAGGAPSLSEWFAQLTPTLCLPTEVAWCNDPSVFHCGGCCNVISCSMHCVGVTHLWAVIIDVTWQHSLLQRSLLNPKQVYLTGTTRRLLTDKEMQSSAETVG